MPSKWQLGPKAALRTTFQTVEVKRGMKLKFQKNVSRSKSFLDFFKNVHIEKFTPKRAQKTGGEIRPTKMASFGT